MVHLPLHTTIGTTSSKISVKAIPCGIPFLANAMVPIFKRVNLPKYLDLCLKSQ